MTLTDARHTIRLNAYRMTRYYLLGELLLTRARLRVGTASEATCLRDRKHFQGELFKLRKTRRLS
jgi:hypothetical protein